MNTAEKKAKFLEEYSGNKNDKWAAVNVDGSEQVFKHVHGGADQVAGFIDWEKVRVVENDYDELEPNVFDL